jgi:hypothetical protein
MATSEEVYYEFLLVTTVDAKERASIDEFVSSGSTIIALLSLSYD